VTATPFLHHQIPFQPTPPMIQQSIPQYFPNNINVSAVDQWTPMSNHPHPATAAFPFPISPQQHQTTTFQYTQSHNTNHFHSSILGVGPSSSSSSSLLPTPSIIPVTNRERNRE
jgi:hypothetical protein